MVWKGRKTGIFSTWEECAAQVHGFTGARYKSYSNRAAAEAAWHGQAAASVGKPAAGKEWLFGPDPPIRESYCVDAACSGNPGVLEYRGVDLRSGKQVFHQGPFQHGTNNVGEFLAIVHALRLLEKARSGLAVYSDSSTAIGWIKKKHCNTTLKPDRKNAPLFELIQQSESWLVDHPYANPILKWDTQAWGEIPADFNRK